jgi:hypothetical protein
VICVTAWSRVLLEKLTGFQLIKKFPAFHGNRSFVTATKNQQDATLAGKFIVACILLVLYII